MPSKKFPVSGKKLHLPKISVRCLGPKKKEHWFLSTSKGIRRCPDCERLVQGLSKLQVGASIYWGGPENLKE